MRLGFKRESQDGGTGLLGKISERVKAEPQPATDEDTADEKKQNIA
jgi:hypothetical protein